MCRYLTAVLGLVLAGSAICCNSSNDKNSGDSGEKPQVAVPTVEQERQSLAGLKAAEFARLKAQAMDASLDISKRVCAVMEAAELRTKESADFLAWLWDNPLPIPENKGLEVDKRRIIEMCDYNPYAEDLVKNALQHGSDDVRQVAMRVLPTIIGRQATAPLLEGIFKNEKNSPHIRNAAAKQLAELTNTAAYEDRSAVATAVVEWAKSAASGPYLKGDVLYFLYDDSLRGMEGERLRLYQRCELKLLEKERDTYTVWEISVTGERATAIVAMHIQPPADPVPFPHCGWKVDLAKTGGRWLAVHAAHNYPWRKVENEWCHPDYREEFSAVRREADELAEFMPFNPAARYVYYGSDRAPGSHEVLPATWTLQCVDAAAQGGNRLGLFTVRQGETPQPPIAVVEVQSIFWFVLLEAEEGELQPGRAAELLGKLAPLFWNADDIHGVKGDVKILGLLQPGRRSNTAGRTFIEMHAQYFTASPFSSPVSLQEQDSNRPRRDFRRSLEISRRLERSGRAFLQRNVGMLEVGTWDRTCGGNGAGFVLAEYAPAAGSRLQPLDFSQSGRHQSGDWEYEITVEPLPNGGVMKKGKFLKWPGSPAFVLPASPIVTPWGIMTANHSGKSLRHGWLPQAEEIAASQPEQDAPAENTDDEPSRDRTKVR